MAEENSKRLSFYNLLVHLRNNDRLTEESAALKNIWGQEHNIFLNLYFYRTKQSKVIDSAYIHDILDLTTEKYYSSCEPLLEDFQKHAEQTSQLTDEEETGSEKFNFRHLEEYKDDIVILTFMAKCAACYSPVKEKAIHSYIKSRRQEYNTLSTQYLNAYLKELNPREKDFYRALNNLNAKTPSAACELAREAVKICICDGELHYKEKLYIAELLQKLRLHGLHPDVGF